MVKPKNKPKFYAGKKITPETAEKKAIRDYLNLIGAFHYPNTAGLGSYPGVPDITCLIKGKVYQIEVKAKGGKQSENQEKFQENWEYHGGTYILGGLDEVIKAIKQNNYD